MPKDACALPLHPLHHKVTFTKQKQFSTGVNLHLQIVAAKHRITKIGKDL